MNLRQLRERERQRQDDVAIVLGLSLVAIVIGSVAVIGFLVGALMGTWQ